MGGITLNKPTTLKHDRKTNKQTKKKRLDATCISSLNSNFAATRTKEYRTFYINDNKTFDVKREGHTVKHRQVLPPQRREGDHPLPR